MPYVNLGDPDLPRQPFSRKGKRRVIPRHVIRQWAREAFLEGKPGFSCPGCHTNYAESFGRMAKTTAFSTPALYCLDCCDTPEVHAI